MERFKGQKHGFTLVEVLIGLFILALAALFTMPALTKGLEQDRLAEERQALMAAVEQNMERAVSDVRAGRTPAAQDGRFRIVTEKRDNGLVEIRLYVREEGRDEKVFRTAVLP